MRRNRGIAIEPLRDRAALRVERHAEAAKRPAVVRHRHEEARRQAVQRADLAADQRHAAAEPHRADAEHVDRPHDLGFELRQPRIGIHIVDRPEQLFLRVHVTRGAVAADADADRAGRAALPLRLPDGVQDALAHAFECPIGAAKMRQLGRHRILRVHVLAAAALENQLHLDVVALPLLEVDDRRARPEVVAAVLAGERIDGVRPQLAAPGRFGHRVLDLLLDPDLVHADRGLDLEGRHAGVLADRAFALGRLVDVLADDRERLRGAGAFGLLVHREPHRGANVRRQVGRGLDDE